MRGIVVVVVVVITASCCASRAPEPSSSVPQLVGAAGRVVSLLSSNVAPFVVKVSSSTTTGLTCYTPRCTEYSRTTCSHIRPTTCVCGRHLVYLCTCRKNQVSWTTNVRAWYLGMPFITRHAFASSRHVVLLTAQHRSVFTVCTALYLVCLVTGFNGPDLAYVCISASKILPGFQRPWH